MRAIITIIFLIQYIFVFGQNLPIIETTVGKKLDFSKKVQKDWEKIHDIFSSGRKWSDYTKEEIELINKYNAEVMPGMWNVLGDACSWYCGAGQYNVKASSELPDNGKFSYKAVKLCDFNYKTSWVEGVKGYGIGETIEFSFPPEHPRLTKIIIVNGYVKSKKTWEDNSRVKKLKMYVNNKPFAIINLKDVYAEQFFTVKPIGNSRKNDYELLKKMPSWSIKFEILDVFKGERYDDTAITEIYFDGLDVHCLAKGTYVTMSDNSRKRIENLNKGDLILSYNIAKNEFEQSKILGLKKIKHDDLIEIQFSDNTKIICTKDHPFLSKNNVWVSILPQKIKTDYLIDNVEQMSINSNVISTNGQVRVLRISKIRGEQDTYTILKLDKNDTYIANGIVTRIE